MIDHAYKVVSDVYQNISNPMGTSDQDLTAQNACMESLHDLDESISEADCQCRSERTKSRANTIAELAAQGA